MGIHTEAIAAVAVSCEPLADLFPVSCILPEPAPSQPTLLAVNGRIFMPLLLNSPLSLSPPTLLGLLSTPEATRSSGQRTSQSASHPVQPVSPPPLRPPCSAHRAPQPPPPVQLASPPPPPIPPTASLAFPHQPKQKVNNPCNP